MTTVSVKVEKNGRILIPAELRRKLGIKEGESEVVLQVDDDNVLQVSTRRRALKRLQHKLRNYTGNLADELIAERRSEAAKE